MLLKSFSVLLCLKPSSYSNKMWGKDCSSDGQTLRAKSPHICSLRIAEHFPWWRPSTSMSWEPRCHVTARRGAQLHIHVALSLCSWPKTLCLFFCWPRRRAVGPAWRSHGFWMGAHESQTCIAEKVCGEVIWAHLLLRGVPVRSGCSGLRPVKFWLSSLSLSWHSKCSIPQPPWWPSFGLAPVCPHLSFSGEPKQDTALQVWSHKWNPTAKQLAGISSPTSFSSHPDATTHESEDSVLLPKYRCLSLLKDGHSQTFVSLRYLLASFVHRWCQTSGSLWAFWSGSWKLTQRCFKWH